MWRQRTTVPLQHLILPFPEDGNDGGAGQQGQGQQGNQQGQQAGGTGQGQQGQQAGGTGGTGGTGQGQQGNQQNGQQGQSGGSGQSVDDLPDWAQKLIKDARSEAGSARTNAKATAAQEARDQLLQELGKALGFVKDQPLDPAKLAEDLAAKDGKLKDTTVQLAVLRAAPKVGGDPEALLDSRSFLDSLSSLDPASDGFAGQVSAAIAQAVKDNPRLGAGTPVGSGGGEIQGGTREGGGGGSWEDIQKRVRAGRGK
jgi:hypothetical protein